MTIPSQPHIQYRKDIDGLRAVAVLSVIAFHINEDWLQGGFLGVDIFFVISGYLISLLLIKEATTHQTISLASFYERRIRRIMPALLVVIAASLVSGLFLMTPDHLTALCQSTLWSLLSLANVHFYNAISTDYFADGSGEIPLLHLWSLGVEEQFYLVWPLLLLLIIKCFPANKWRIIAVSLIAVASLFLAHVLLKSNPTFAYYMLPTRAWELLAGCIAALLTAQRLQVNKSLAESLSLIGLIAIFYSMKHVSKEDPIPGFAALPAILGAAILIWTGGFQNTVASRLLSIKPAVAIGLISYSAYLWHWPILAFIRFVTANIEIAPLTAKMVLPLTLLLAFLSYRFLEKPTRQAKLTTQSVFFFYLAAPIAAISLTCFFIQNNIDTKSPWLINWQSYNQLLKADTATNNHLLCGSGKTYDVKLDNNPDCIYPSSTATSVMLVGDSNAEHYLPALRVFAGTFHFSFTHRTSSTCPFLLDEKPVPWIMSEYQDSCQQYRKTLSSNIDKYSTLIIGGSWTSYDKKKQRQEFRQRFSDTIKQVAASHERIIILGKIPRFSQYNHQCAMRALRLPWLDCKTAYNNEQPDHDVNQFIRELANQYNNVYYFDVRHYLCNKNNCSPYFHDIPAYRDGGHLNAIGAIAIAQAMVDAKDPSLSIFTHLP